MSSSKPIEASDWQRPLDIFNDRYFGQRLSSSTFAPVAFPLFLALPKELRLKIWTWHLYRRRFLRVLLEETTAAQVNTPDRDTPDPVMGSSAHHDSSEQDEGNSVFSMAPHRREGRNENTGSAPQDLDPLLQITFFGMPLSPALALSLVCQESYEAYTSFYRVRLPSLARIPSEDEQLGYKTVRIVAHLHPGLDILSLETLDPLKILAPSLLPAFLHTFLQYDSSPAHIRFGVRNLCVNLTRFGSDCHLSLNEYEHQQESIAPLPPAILASVRLTVSHLRNLYLRLVLDRCLEPRVMSGPLDAMSLPWYNASMPLLPASSWDFPGTVEPVEGGDPRLIQPEGAADLRQVRISHQVQPSLDVWARRERAWGVRAGAELVGGGGGDGRGGSFQVRALVGLPSDGLASQVQRRLSPQVRALVGLPSDLGLASQAQRCLSPHDRGVRSCASLMDHLREEHADWLWKVDPAHNIGNIYRKMFQTSQRRFLHNPQCSALDGDEWDDDGPAGMSPEEWLLKRQPHTAVGFWLVDPKALEAAPTVGYVTKKIVDLSGTRREAIQLWVFDGRPSKKIGPTKI